MVGEIAATGDTRISGESSSHRDNQGFDCSKCNREATWIFTPGNGGDWSIKMGSHGEGSDSGSLIELGNVDTDGGGGEWRCEGPHNSYGDVSGGSGSGPALGGKAKVGLKGITWSTGAETVHHEVWYDEVVEEVIGLKFQSLMDLLVVVMQLHVLYLREQMMHIVRIL